MFVCQFHQVNDRPNFNLTTCRATAISSPSPDFFLAPPLRRTYNHFHYNTHIFAIPPFPIDINSRRTSPPGQRRSPTQTTPPAYTAQYSPISPATALDCALITSALTQSVRLSQQQREFHSSRSKCPRTLLAPERPHHIHHFYLLFIRSFRRRICYQLTALRRFKWICC